MKKFPPPNLRKNPGGPSVPPGEPEPVEQTKTPIRLRALRSKAGPKVAEALAKRLRGLRKTEPEET